MDGRIYGPSVHFFLIFQKERFQELNSVLNVTGKHRTICIQFTGADISECTNVESKIEQNKLSCAVEAVTSRDHRCNVLGCSQTAADSKQKHYVTVQVMQDLC